MRLRRACSSLLLVGLLMAAGVNSSRAADSTERSSPVAPKVSLRDEMSFSSGSDTAPGPQSLGSVSSDLVFTPVTPCRLWDTRNTIGPFTGAQTFGVSGNVNPITQGGTLATCGLPVSDPVAVVLNVTAIGWSPSGWTYAYAAGSPVPVATILNWGAGGEVVPNTTVVPVCQGCGTGVDVVINNFAAAYSFADVLGYFNPPQSTKLDRVVLSNSVAVTTASDSFVRTANCSTAGTNYTLTGGGGGFNVSPPSGWNFTNLILSISGPEFSSSGDTSGDWIMAARNNTGVSQNLVAYAICMRVPGI
jgi:hypothetical protein